MPTPVDYRAMIAHVDGLPDDALLPDPAAALLLGISVDTLRRSNPVPPIQVAPRCRSRRLGDIRKRYRQALPAEAS